MATRTGGELPERIEVAVIGAGAIGACAALALAREGRGVLVIDRGRPGGGASAGTACLVTVSHAERMANREALGEGVRALADPAGPLVIRPAARLLPWLARYTAASLDATAAQAGTDLLVRLAQESAAGHRRLHAEIDTGLVERGLLTIYTGEAGLAGRERTVRELRARGVAIDMVDRTEVGELEPAVRGALGATLCHDDAHVDSRRFTERVAAAAERAGALLCTGVEVHRARAAREGIRIDTGAGTVLAERIVLAAGAWSPALGRDLGLELPIAAAKGYHVELAGESPLRRPVFINGTRVVATPLDGRTRLAGTLELGRERQRIDERRVEAIAQAGLAHVVGLAGARRTSIWAGSRPLTADGMPMIGCAPGDGRVVVAAGHGMLGIVLAPVTASLVCALVGGGTLAPELAPLRLDRFRRFARSA